MTSYDEKGVPILNFHNPAAAIFYPNGLYTYAMGNTQQRSITEQIGTTKEQHLDLLLLACGDLRNTLSTVSELSLRTSLHRPRSVHFHLNDYDPSIVARNAIIIEIVTQINPDVPGDVDFLWDVWYNMTLSEPHHDRLRQVISSLAERKFDGDDGVFNFQNTKSQQECHDIWKDWMDLDLDVKQVKEERNQLIKTKISIEQIIEYTMLQIGSGILTTSNKYLEYLQKESCPLNQEMKHWFLEGSTTDHVNLVNSTLIRPFVHEWKVHYTSCPFQGYLPFHM